MFGLLKLRLIYSAVSSTATAASGRPTSSIYAIGALSPVRRPHLRIRVYPPGRSWKRGPNSVNNLPTTSASRVRANAKRRFATLSLLASVIRGSTTRRSSFALATVVLNLLYQLAELSLAA